HRTHDRGLPPADEAAAVLVGRLRPVLGRTRGAAAAVTVGRLRASPRHRPLSSPRNRPCRARRTVPTRPRHRAHTCACQPQRALYVRQPRPDRSAGTTITDTGGRPYT